MWHPTCQGPFFPGETAISSRRLLPSSAPRTPGSLRSPHLAPERQTEPLGCTSHAPQTNRSSKMSNQNASPATDQKLIDVSDFARTEYGLSAATQNAMLHYGQALMAIAAAGAKAS